MNDDEIEDSTCDELEITDAILKWCKELQKIYEAYKAEITDEIKAEIKAEIKTEVLTLETETI